MYKPLFFTAVMAVIACFTPEAATAGTEPSTAQASKQCPDGKVWDNEKRKCVRWQPRGSH